MQAVLGSSYFLFISYLPWCTQPDIPHVSSQAFLPFLACCHQTATGMFLHSVSSALSLVMYKKYNSSHPRVWVFSQGMHTYLEYLLLFIYVIYLYILIGANADVTNLQIIYLLAFFLPITNKKLTFFIYNFSYKFRLRINLQIYWGKCIVYQWYIYRGIYRVRFIIYFHRCGRRYLIHHYQSL